MLPDNMLSSSPVLADFGYPVKMPNPEDYFQDWEIAGVSLNDPSQGMLVKLWHCTLDIPQNSDIGYVYVEALEVPKTLLFSGIGISEVSIAFDQNMNPFVAYVQEGFSKFYWYDPTIPGMTHTTMPVGCIDLRCCMDDKRQFNIQNSDILLAYKRADNLCIRYQRDRYLIEYILATGITENLVHIGMNKSLRVQFGLGYLP